MYQCVCGSCERETERNQYTKERERNDLAIIKRGKEAYIDIENEFDQKTNKQICNRRLAVNF